jgi:hypothetical protein
MPYQHRVPPGNDTASAFLRTELPRISQAMDSPARVRGWQVLYGPPEKYAAGTEVYADGTTWNPGSGPGLYVYDGSTWRPVTSEIGWRDLIGSITLRGTPGANSPTWEAITGMTGIYAYSFSAGTMNEVWVNYHLDHDIYVGAGTGSKIYLHTHWLNAAAAPNTGAVRWGFEYTVAKGHQQQAFPATTTVYVNQTCNATRYMHHIAEVAVGDAIDAEALEPDTLILCRIFRDAADAADTCTDKVYLLLADCHYQSNRTTTLRKSPNFYQEPFVITPAAGALTLTGYQPTIAIA